MKERLGRSLIYIAALAGIGIVILAMARLGFRYGRYEAVVHIAVWSIVIGTAAFTDIGCEGKASDISMLAVLALLAVVISQPASKVFAFGNLAHAPASMMFILIAAAALMIDKEALVRSCLGMAVIIGIYSSKEFPAYEYLGNMFNYLMYISEQMLIIAAFIYTFRLSPEKLCLPGLRLSQFINELLFPEEINLSGDCSLWKRKNSCFVQAASIAAACAVLGSAAFMFNARVPWFYLAFLTLFMGVTIWQSSYSEYRYDNHMIATAMVIKMAVDLSWELAPAEYDYMTIYALLDAFLAVSAAGNCRRLFNAGTVSQLILALIVVTEYYFDPAVFTLTGGQMVVLSKVLIAAGISMYALVPWSDQEDEVQVCKEEVTGNEA